MRLCQSCQQFLQKKSSNPKSRIAVLQRITHERKIDCIYFCKICGSFLKSIYQVEQIHPIESKILSTNEITDKIKWFTLIALYGWDRRKFIEKRMAFLKNRTMLVYEPIDEEAYDEFLKARDDEKEEETLNVILLSSDSDSNDEEMDSSFWFVYADPQDHLIANLDTKVSRYFSSYVIPASDFQPLTFVQENSPPELVLATSCISSISKPQIYDAENRIWMNVQEFLSSVSKEELCMHIPHKERSRFLTPYRKFLSETIKLS